MFRRLEQIEVEQVDADDRFELSIVVAEQQLGADQFGQIVAAALQAR